MIEQITKHFKKGRIFSFSGRMNRLAYFKRLLITSVIFFALCTLPDNLKTIVDDYINFIYEIIYAVTLIMLILYQIAIMARRLHDINYSGYFVLPYVIIIIILLPFYEVQLKDISRGLSLAYLGLLCRKGTVGPNKYGEDPLRDIINLPKQTSNAE